MAWAEDHHPRSTIGVRVSNLLNVACRRGLICNLQAVGGGSIELGVHIGLWSATYSSHRQAQTFGVIKVIKYIVRQAPIANLVVLLAISQDL